MATARLDQVILNIEKIFTENATENKIPKERLPELLNLEIKSTELTEKLKPEEFTRAIDKLEKKGADEIDFKEFVQCVTILAKRYYNIKNGKIQKGEKRNKGNKGGKGKKDDEGDEGEKGEKGKKGKKGKGKGKGKDGEKDSEPEE